MKVLLNFLFFLIIFSNVNSWKLFHSGRRQGGNLGIPLSHKSSDAPNNFDRWLTQNLDHFDVENPNTWQQRYLVNDEFFNQDQRNVAFLMIGGEAKASDLWMTGGAWVDYAKNSSAILFQLEHRFYGESRPTKDLSVENLRYLTSEQALADLAFFINFINKEYNLSAEVKWVAFGGSYSGSLAAWARVKYPHLIHGVVSSSGPLLALANFPDYFKVVGDDLRDVSVACHTNINAGTTQVQAYLQDEAGQKQITELFKLCDPIEDHVYHATDLSNFYTILADNFALIAQFNKNNLFGAMSSLLGNITLDTACDIMLDVSKGEEIRGLVNFNSLILEAFGESCLDYRYSSMINSMTNISWDGPASKGERQWIFQTCNEFGFYQTSDNIPQIFGDQFPLNFSIQQCIDIYGDEFNGVYVDAAADRTNTIYGALDIEITNAVFVHGSVDPWHTLGITTTRSEDAPAIFINGTSHCANMYPASDGDPPQLKAARVKIAEHIRTWLNI